MPRPPARPSPRRHRPGAPSARAEPAHRPAAPARTGASGAETETLYGLRAVLAIVSRRPGDVIRGAFDPALRAEVGPLLELARSGRVAVTEKLPADLARIAGAPNHEGVVAEVRARRWLAPAGLAEALVRDRGVAVALDRVRNPYNVGAIVRTAAFFGLGGVLLGAPAPHPALAADAVRVAEGGAEEVPLSRTTDLVTSLAQLRQRGVEVIGVESDGDLDLLRVGPPLARPLVLVVGHEREGLSPRVRAECGRLARIAGVSATFSLNVAIAGSIAIASVAPRR